MPRPLPRIWWLNPGWAFAIAVVPFAVAAYLIPNQEYTVIWQTNRFFDGSDVIFCLECLAAFLAGGLLSAVAYRKKAVPEWGKFSSGELDFLLKMFRVGVSLILIAYFIWALLAAHHGVNLSLLKQEFLGQGMAAYEIRNMMGTWPGVTTAAQFAPAVFILGGILYFNGRKKEVTMWLVILAVMTYLRSIIYSERLAVTEVAIPFFILTIYYNRARFRFFLTGAATFVWPIFALALVYVFFTGTEYLRSWSFYSDQGVYTSVWTFSRDRITAYYVVALNNGSLAYHMLGQSPYPMSTFDWFWRFPIIGPRIFAALAPTYDMSYEELLVSEANPEFNNESGIFAYTTDWGEPGVFLFFFLTGFVIFISYFAFVRGSLPGLLCYPFIFTGLTEMARVPYWTTTRAFPTWLWFGLVLLGLWRMKRRQKLRQREESQLFPSRAPLAVTAAAPRAPLTGTSAAPAAPTRK